MIDDVLSPNDRIPNWRLYERMVPAIEAENLGAGIALSVKMNASLVGALSGVERQIDLLVEARWDDGRRRRMIIDAKNYSRPLNVKDIEAFKGMMRDCRAEPGILVSSNGWSVGAARRAQDLITLKLLSVEDARERTDWAMMFGECYGCRANVPDPRRRGVVLWDGQLPWALSGMWAIVWTGKCDTCHNFQVWCWDCGDIFSLGIGDHYTCDCERHWSTAVIEERAVDEALAGKAIHLVLASDGQRSSIDRRSLD